MPGSGKTLVADAMAAHGFFAIGLSQYIGEAPVRDTDPLDATRARWRQSVEVRKASGAAAVVERAWAGLGDNPPHRLIFDGVRSLRECAFLAARTDLTVFQRSAELRYSRLRAGANPAYSSDSSALCELDAHEIRLGVGEVIAIADIVYFSHARETALANDTARAAAAISEAALRMQDNRKDDGGCRPDYAALQALITA